MSKDTSVYKNLAIAFLLAIVAALGVASFFLWRESADPRLIGNWTFASQDFSSGEPREYVVRMDLRKQGTFSVSESFLSKGSLHSSSFQFAGKWRVQGNILRLVSEKSFWNEDVEYREYEILEVRNSRMVLQQDGQQFHFRREMR